MIAYRIYEKDDIDGNRGIMEIHYELEQDDYEWIIDDLYDWFCEFRLEDASITYLDDDLEFELEEDWTEEKWIIPILERLFEDDTIEPKIKIELCCYAKELLYGKANKEANI